MTNSQIHSNTITNNKNVRTYKRPTNAFFVGFILLIIALIQKYIKTQEIFSLDYDDIFIVTNVILKIISLTIRIIAAFWVTQIAKRQNRNILGWGIFAFFVPPIALMWLGLSRRIEIVEQNTSVTQDLQS